MTKLFPGRENADRMLGQEAVAEYLNQYRKLRHLSDLDVAHRMAVDLPTAKKWRRLFGRGTASLLDVNLGYSIRLTLGKYKIKTLGQLQAKSDEELLSIPSIGEKRLALIREKVAAYLEK